MSIFLLPLFLLLGLAIADDGLQAWLRYAPLPDAYHHPNLPSRIVTLNDSHASPVYTAGQELQKGLLGIFSKQVDVSSSSLNSSDSSIVVGTIDQYNSAIGGEASNCELEPDGFSLRINGNRVRILGQNERGALYGAFEYLSMLAQGNFSNVDYSTNPAAPIRWTNEWDNMDGSIERGFAGKSIFFDNGTIVSNLTRAAEYARLLSSIRINAVVVNNVNANYTTLRSDNIEGLARIADVFRPYGVQLGMSLYFASPANLTNLTTFDPLNEQVIDFWHNKTAEIYSHIPDMAGYLVKANSEGQPGPITYNRTLAEGANLFAKALKPYGGILMFRAFVYDMLNESDWYADRAKAAVDYFKPLDGDFDDNVVVQIKYGPIDFQVREPASPLFANLRNTSMAIELQVAQEYLGQQCHLVYLPPLWKTVTDFDLRINNSSSVVHNIMTGKVTSRPLGGSAAVVNVGQNTTWLGSHLAMSNLYAYGRMAWDWTLEPEAILQDWIRLTLGHNEQVLNTLTDMSMASWPAYEDYSGNLGIQTLTDILYTHFGPNPQTADNTPWGQWTRADATSIGMDRTVSNGTAYSGQYPPEIAAQYENIPTTPDNLLLWFHHVPYTHRLHSGQTVIQHFYDAHYRGAQIANGFVPQWESLASLVDSQVYDDVLYRLKYQAGHALVWRDAIVNFYHNRSGIPDEAGRVGFHPWRVEAESMNLTNYQVYDVSPFETASGSKAIVTTSNSTSGTAFTTLTFPDGTYDIAVNYYDMYGGNSSYILHLNDYMVGSWTADDVDVGRLGHTPSIYLDGHSATRITFKDVQVRKGDMLMLKGKASGIEPAPVDYIAVLPRGIVD